MGCSRNGTSALGLAVFWVVLSAQTDPQAQQVEKQKSRTEPTVDEIVVVGRPDQNVSQWLCAESINFQVYGRSQKNVVLVAEKLERFRQLLHLITGVKPEQAAIPLRVFLVESSAQMQRLRRLPYAQGTSYTGYYSASPSGAVLAADITLDTNRNVLPTYYETWLYSEYTRHFMSQYAGDTGVPVWYIDGLALYLSTVQFTGNRIEYGPAHPTLVQWLNGARWEPIGNILSGKVRSGQIYSAESMLLVHYLFSSPTNGARLAEFLSASKSGADPVLNFERVFATDMPGLQNKLWNYRSSLSKGHILTLDTTDPQISVVNLPASADALLLDQAAISIGVPETDRQQSILRRARSVHARESDSLSQRVLVEAEILYGAPHSIDSLLGAMLATAPNDADLLYLKGLQHLLTGRQSPYSAKSEYSEARQWFSRAYKEDPTQYQFLYRYAESLATEREFVSENTINILQKASLLAPQATQIRISTAMMMMAYGRFDKANQVLSDIVINRRDPASLQVPNLLQQVQLRRSPSTADLIASFRYVATWQDLNCC